MRDKRQNGGDTKKWCFDVDRNKESKMGKNNRQTLGKKSGGSEVTQSRGRRGGENRGKQATKTERKGGSNRPRPPNHGGKKYRAKACVQNNFEKVKAQALTKKGEKAKEGDREEQSRLQEKQNVYDGKQIGKEKAKRGCRHTANCRGGKRKTKKT